MTLIPRDPWEELERLQSDMNRMWTQFFKKLNEETACASEIGFVPDVDVVETGKEYRIYVSLPGLLEEDIDLLLEDQLLIIRGERLPPYDADRRASSQTEWRYGYFERQLRLPRPIDRRSLRAHYDAGVFTVVVAKAIHR